MDSSVKIINEFKFVKTVDGFVKVFFAMEFQNSTKFVIARKCGIKVNENESSLHSIYMFILNNSVDYASGIDICDKFYQWCFS